MTLAQVIAHWREGASDSPRLARRAAEDVLYELALFHSHLAIEKALKATYMEQHAKKAPYTHSLLDLMEMLGRPWTEEQKAALNRLTDFVVAAWYSDPTWAQEYATDEHASRGIADAQEFLSLLEP